MEDGGVKILGCNIRMAGRVQLQTVGPQDRSFTDDPEYTYFIKNFKKHGNYARFYDDLDFTGRVEFGEEIRCVIPQNQGDLLKGLSLKITLGAIDQSLSPSSNVTYCESIAQAMIDYTELYIGGHSRPKNTIRYVSHLFRDIRDTIKTIRTQKTGW